MDKEQIKRIEKLIYYICDDIIDGANEEYILDKLNEILEVVGSEVSTDDIIEGLY